ncbi:MAG TPA: hypothetical protein VF267_01985 [Gammaproteobacteria bacterium]
MDVRNLLLVVAWLAGVTLTGAPPGPAPYWQPPVRPDAGEPPSLDTAHRYAERPHERWLPGILLDWRRPRELAMDMVCDLGLIALAIVDCGWAATDRVPDVLILTPLRKDASEGGAFTPDFHDLRRRSIEERMNSI